MANEPRLSTPVVAINLNRPVTLARCDESQVMSRPLPAFGRRLWVIQSSSVFFQAYTQYSGPEFPTAVSPIRFSPPAHRQPSQRLLVNDRPRPVTSTKTEMSVIPDIPVLA